MEIKIYHNPRCRKSREALQIIKHHNFDPKIILYLENPPDKKMLSQIINYSGLPVKNFVRTGEEAYKANYKGKDLSENEILEAFEKFPKLLQRPIVVKGDRAIIARDAEKLEAWLKTRETYK